MTRKNYKDAADRIKQIQVPSQKVAIINFMVQFFLADNVRFDEKKFRDACYD